MPIALLCRRRNNSLYKPLSVGGPDSFLAFVLEHSMEPCKRSRQRVSLSLSTNLGEKLPSYRALCALTSHAPLIPAVEDASQAS